MFGLLLFSAVVLSAVDVGSLLTLSARIHLHLNDDSGLACGATEIGGYCFPTVYSALTVADNNRVLVANGETTKIFTDSPVNLNYTSPDFIANDTQLPMLLRVVAGVKIVCPDAVKPECKVPPRTITIGSVVRLIKVSTLSSRPEHIEVQILLDDVNAVLFNASATLFVDYDTSGSKETECEDHSTDFCPKNLPYSCPIFSDNMTNPCCAVNVDSSCMKRTESIIRKDTGQLRGTINTATATDTAATGPTATGETATDATATGTTVTGATATGSVNDTSSSTTPCRENVYFWVMIEFILLTVILLISLIVSAVFPKRFGNNFVEEEEPEEEDPQQPQ